MYNDNINDLKLCRIFKNNIVLTFEIHIRRYYGIKERFIK